MNSRRDRASRPWLLYALGVVAIVVAVLAVSEIGPPTSSARTSKEVVAAAQGVVQSTVTGSGNIAAGTDLTVNFNTSGTLQDVYVKVGQHVNAGQLLADLDPTSANLQLSQSQSQLTAAEDQLTCLQDQTTANCGSSGSGGGAGSSSGSSGSGSSGSSSTTSYTPSSSGTVEFASFKPGAGQEADDRNRRDADEGLDEDHEEDPERDRDGDRAEHEVALEQRRVGREDQLDRDDHDDLDAVAEQPRLGPGVGLQRAGGGAHRRDRDQQHQALRAHERHDRLAIEPHAR